jgi:hypothetical protein
MVSSDQGRPVEESVEYCFSEHIEKQKKNKQRERERTETSKGPAARAMFCGMVGVVSLNKNVFFVSFSFSSLAK